MVEGKIYYCQDCHKMLRFNTECQCGATGQQIGWMVSNEEVR
jgi:hypothetical protein